MTFSIVPEFIKIDGVERVKYEIKKNLNNNLNSE